MKKQGRTKKITSIDKNRYCNIPATCEEKMEWLKANYGFEEIKSHINPDKNYNWFNSDKSQKIIKPKLKTNKEMGNGISRKKQ